MALLAPRLIATLGLLLAAIGVVLFLLFIYFIIPTGYQPPSIGAHSYFLLGPQEPLTAEQRAKRAEYLAQLA